MAARLASYGIIRVLRAGLATAIVSFPVAGPSQPTDAASVAALERRVQELHRRARPLDAHVDVLVPSTPAIYLTPDGGSQAALDKLLAGGLATVTLAIAAPNGPETEGGMAEARAVLEEKLAKVKSFAADSAGRVELAFGSTDIERINGAGNIAVLLGFQNAYALGTDIDGVDRWLAAGVRVFGFNHAGNNAFADSSRPQVAGHEPHGGLSALGREAVARLNRAGAVIDVSQLTPRAVLEAVALSAVPVIASHSAVRALVDEPRNLSDAEIDAIAAGGGVVHVPPFNTYVAPRPPEFIARLSRLRAEHGLAPEFRGVLDGVEALARERRGAYTAAALAAVPRATLADYVDHIDYVVRRVGIDHVGIGTDFDHGAGIVGFADLSEAPNLTRELVRRGYSDDDVIKIWSGNFMRVLRAAERHAGGAPTR